MQMVSKLLNYSMITQNKIKAKKSILIALN